MSTTPLELVLIILVLIDSYIIYLGYSKWSHCEKRRSELLKITEELIAVIKKQDEVIHQYNDIFNKNSELLAKGYTLPTWVKPN